MVLLLTACPSSDPQQPPVQLTPSPSTKLADLESQPSDDPREAQAQAGDTGLAEDDVIEIEGPETKQGRNIVPVSPISPTPTSVQWTERGRIDDPALELVFVATGVLGRSSKGVYTLGEDGHLQLQPGLALPETPLLGHWPTDMWTFASKPHTPDGQGQPRFEYTISQLDKDGLWVERPYAKKHTTWIAGPQAVRKGWLTGLLIRNGSQLTRIGSTKEAPKIGMRMGKQVLDTFEANSGRLYNISLRHDSAYVQATCFTRSCLDEQAKKLPFGGKWSFSIQVPRQRNSLTMLAQIDAEGAVSHQLLHYETGGWSLETLLQEPRGMWPNTEGGLWMLTGDELRYRVGPGQWYAVALPEGASEISVAIDPDLRELWLAVKQGEQTVLYTTPALVPVEP
jgi:hypothetical protein